MTMTMMMMMMMMMMTLLLLLHVMSCELVCGGVVWFLDVGGGLTVPP